MLNEEGLILLGTLVAAGLIVLHVINVLWPTPPKPVRRATPAGPRPERAAADVVGGHGAGERGGSARAVVKNPVVPEPVVPTPAPVEEPPSFERVEAAMRTVVIPPPPAPEPEPAPTMAAAAEAAPEGAGGDPAEVLGRCRALAQDRRFGEVVEEATAVLNQPGRADRGTAAQLWREVALARAAMGDQEAALTAFRNAVDTAPEAGRGAMREAFAEWAAAAAQAGVAAAEEGARFDALRAAKTLLEEAAAAAGPHAAIARVATSIEPEYWPAYESHVQTLIAERDFGEAYRLATEALADTDLPAGRRGVFEDFRAETMSARITALIERAVIGMDEHREWEAVGALERAETLFRSATTLSAERRAETARQLAEAYGRLGRRRVDAGEFDDAVDPLFRALRIGPPDSDKRDDARWALVQALQGVVDARVAMIREVAAAGSRDSAVVQADKLWALLRSGMAAGVPQESMTNAVAATRKLIEDLGGTA